MITVMNPQPMYLLKDNWIIRSQKEQSRRICWVPLALKGHNPLFESNGDFCVLGNETGRVTILDLSNVQRPWDSFPLVHRDEEVLKATWVTTTLHEEIGE